MPWTIQWRTNNINITMMHTQQTCLVNSKSVLLHCFFVILNSFLSVSLAVCLNLFSFYFLYINLSFLIFSLSHYFCWSSSFNLSLPPSLFTLFRPYISLSDPSYFILLQFLPQFFSPGDINASRTKLFSGRFKEQWSILSHSHSTLTRADTLSPGPPGAAVLYTASSSAFPSSWPPSTSSPSQPPPSSGSSMTRVLMLRRARFWRWVRNYHESRNGNKYRVINFTNLRITKRLLLIDLNFQQKKNRPKIKHTS